MPRNNQTTFGTFGTTGTTMGTTFGSNFGTTFGTTTTNTTSSSSSSRNRALVPEATGALRTFRDEIAAELGMNFEGYNGDKTARDCGRVGGEMVRRLIEQSERNLAGRSTTTTGRRQ